MNVPADTHDSYSSRSSSDSVPRADLPARRCMRMFASAEARRWITLRALSGVMHSPSGSRIAVRTVCGEAIVTL
jgi:hypothetical protein